jgi:hypothetical protein
MPNIGWEGRTECFLLVKAVIIQCIAGAARAGKLVRVMPPAAGQAVDRPPPPRVATPARPPPAAARTRQSTIPYDVHVSAPVAPVGEDAPWPGPPVRSHKQLTLSFVKSNG